MTSHLLQGSNDAERILRGGNQSNTGNRMNWINGTNNLGRAGHREHHAEGDTVGQEQPAAPVQQQAAPAEGVVPAQPQKRRGFLGNVVRGVGRAARTANTVRKVVQPIAKAGAEAYATKGASLMRAEGGSVEEREECHAYGDVTGQQPYAGYQQPQSIGQTAQPTNQVSQQMPSQQPIEQQQQMSRGGVAGYKRGY